MASPTRPAAPRSPRLSAAPLALCVLAACSAPNLSRTVGKGNWELHGNHGGPLLRPPGLPPVPMGHTNLGVRYGVTDDFDVDANVNLLPFFVRVWETDVAGVLQLYRRPRKLAVSASARLYFFGDLDDAPKVRLYPQLGLHVGRPLGRWFHPYGGLLLAFQFARRADATPVFFTPFLAVEFLMPPRRGRQHGFGVHSSWTNPWTDTDVIVDYAPPRGALAVYLTYRVRFGGWDR